MTRETAYQHIPISRVVLPDGKHKHGKVKIRGHVCCVKPGEKPEGTFTSPKSDIL